MNIKEMSKEEATRRLAENIGKVNKLLQDCQEIRRVHQIFFTYNYDSLVDNELVYGDAEMRWESSSSDC